MLLPLIYYTYTRGFVFFRRIRGKASELIFSHVLLYGNIMSIISVYASNTSTPIHGDSVFSVKNWFGNDGFGCQFLGVEILSSLPPGGYFQMDFLVQGW